MCSSSSSLTLCQLMTNSSKAGTLISTNNLIMNLMLGKEPMEERMEALRGQVEVARSRADNKWLLAVAKDADCLQFAGPAWIDTNIFKLGRKASKSAESVHCSTDIRLKTDPNLERKRTNAADPFGKAIDDLEGYLGYLSEENLDYEDVTQEEDQGVAQVPPRSRVTPEIPPVADTSMEREQTATPSVLEKVQEGDQGVAQVPLRSRVTPEKPPVSTSSMSNKNKRKHWKRRQRRMADRASASATATESEVSALSVETPPKRQKVEVAQTKPKGETGAVRRTSGAHPICPLPWCSRENAYPKAHAINFHFPTSLDMRATDRNANTLRIRALRYLADAVTRTPNCPMTKFVDWMAKNLKMGDYKIDAWLSGVVHQTSETMGWRLPSEPSLCPINAPGLAFHWAVLPRLLARLSVSDYNNVMRMFADPQRQSELSQHLAEEPSLGQNRLLEPSAPENRPLQSLTIHIGSGNSRRNERVVEVVSTEPKRRTVEIQDTTKSDGRPEAFDSHFHLDRLSRNLGLSTPDMEAALRRSRPQEQTVKVIGGVANFCDPDTYPTVEVIRKLAKEGVAVTIGIHPKHSQQMDEACWRRFVKLVEMPEVAGVGEVGLDFTVHASQWSTQRDVLDRALSMLLDRHVLVLHCRGSQPDNFTSLFYQCKGKVPKQQRIHLHCFSGLREDQDRWSGHFVNVHFGYTNMVAGKGFHSGQVEALHHLSLGRLLLETDAPYFPHPGYRISSPNFLGMTAAAVAKHRQEDGKTILAAATQNGRRLYLRK